MKTTRNWLGAACGALLAVACLVAAGQGETPVLEAQALENSALENSAPRGADVPPRKLPDARVCVTLDVTGELVAPTGRDAAAVREPVEMAARFDFDEIAADASHQGATAGPAVAGRLVARRLYRDAAASMHIGESTTNVSLAADARQVLVARRGTTPLPYLANGFLSGEEFDLLDTPFDSVLLEDILPSAPVEIGQTLEIPGDLTAGLLSIDTVESGVIEARVQSVADATATILISGIVDGAVDGVPTHVTVEGSLSVAARSVTATADAADSQPARHELHGRITQASVVLKERRQASHVAPGFEVEARVLVERTALDGAAAAADFVSAADVANESASAVAEQGPPQRRLGAGSPDRVWYRESEGRFDLIHDTRWRRVEDGPNGLVMRLVDRGALLGQCSITSLPQAPAAALPTRADLQRDIERSLAGQLVRVESGEETDRDDGLRIVRLASEGNAGELPFRWIHYVVAAGDGSRASVTFMFEASVQQRFADADRSLIEGLRLPLGQPATPPSQGEKSPPGPTAAVPVGAVQQTR